MTTTAVSTTTHTIVAVEATPASAQRLSGHEAVCSCGYRMGTSLSAAEATRLGTAHVAYMTRKVTAR